MARLYERTEHTFFDNLVAYLAAHQGISLSVQAQSFGYAPSLEEGHYSSLEGNPEITGLRFLYEPVCILEPISSDEWPDRIEFEEEEIETELPIDQRQTHDQDVILQGMSGIFESILRSGFVQYYESHRDELDGEDGGDPNQDWPPTWNFARVVRNAFSHQGLIHFRNEDAPAVSWRDLEYGPNEDGRRILFNDIGVDDVIVLMEEMDDIL
jgi:hypothetical protein